MTPSHHRTATSLSSRHNVRQYVQQQRRAFFNFNIFSPRQEKKEADIDPGIEKMMELAKKERMRARLPPPQEVRDAFVAFFRHKSKQGEASVITDTQAELALRSLKYIVASKDELAPEDARNGTGIPRMVSACKVLRRESPATKMREAHVELARFIFGLGTFSNDRMRTYVFALTRTGQSELARQVVLDRERASTTKTSNVQVEEETDEDVPSAYIGFESAGASPALLAQTWSWVLQGFAREDNTVEVEQTLAMIREREFQHTRNVTITMLNYSLKHGSGDAVKQWLAVYLQQHLSPESKQTDEFLEEIGHQTNKVLRWCIENNELQMGHDIVKQLMSSRENPPKAIWDAIFVWAAGTKKSVDEIERMMDVMEKSNANTHDQSQWRVPDIATINGLVEFAISRNDPYMAERFISLGKERNIEPDAKTLVLQMDYRLSVNDVDGALKAYMNLQAKDLSSNEDVHAVNRLIVALCQTNRHDFDTIMNVAADLSDRRVRFEPLTVSTLSILHLSRDEQDDVLDLLNTHAFHYSSTERQSIRDAIIAFCLDPKTHTSRAWQGYTVLKTIFDELPRPERTELMTSLLTLRERADMGVHVFQNMRMHTRDDTIPTVDTYVAAFMGLAKLRDLESVEVVHNLLKLDYNINTTTYLYNALMIAYTACGKPRTALDFWDDIVASREGPSYNSIHAALRACEKAPFGDVRAQRIWTTLQKRNVDLDQALWASYIAALAGNGDIDLAINTLEEGVGRGEVEVDVFVLGSLFAGAGGAGQVKQRMVEEWGRKEFPGLWAELEGLGVDSDENFVRGFRVDRRVGA